jgi:TM2 domain-containing membrane protein YozV
LLFSIFLGAFGVDRFYLGYTVQGVFKFLTLGGVGLWWLIDIGLMVGGIVQPADGYSWEPHY